MADSVQLGDECDRTAELAAEARYLHQSVFRAAPHPKLVERYLEAHERLEFAEDVDVAKIVRLELDAEAIEYSLRRRRPGNCLTQKMRTLLYLVEIEATYFGEFVLTRRRRFSSWRTLCLAPFRSLRLLWRGSRLLRRHDVG